MITSDACATPGCGHSKQQHGPNGCHYIGVRDYVWGCSCTAYLPPGPVLEEGRPEFDSPHMWEEGTADYPVTVTARNAEAEAENAALSARLERVREVAYGVVDIAITADSPPPHTKYIDVDRLRTALDGEQHDQPDA